MLFVILQYIRVVIKVKISLSMGYEGFAFYGERFYPKTEEMLEKHGYLVDKMESGFLFFGTNVIKDIKQEGTENEKDNF